MPLKNYRAGALRRWGAAALGAALLVGLAACSGTSSGDGDGKSGGTLTVGLFAEPDSLDPATMRLIPSYQAVSSIYDQLLWKFDGAEATEYVPGLATGYEVSEDGKSYTFTLREGVTFHDGTVFDAEAVKYNLDRIVDPDTQSVAAKAALGPYESSTVVDEHTVTVNFKTPNGSFLNNIASPLLAIVSPTAAKKLGPDLARQPVGSGPFMFDSWTAGESVNLKKNPDYTWGPDQDGLSGPVKLDELSFRVVTNSSSQANALQTKALNMGQGMDITDVVRLTENGFEQKQVVASGKPFGFMLNVDKPPTDDVLVRQAIQYAVDTKTINTTVFKDIYPAANTVLTSATFAHDDTPAYSYDPDKAAELLDKAGWVLGSDGVRSKDGTELQLEWLISGGFGFQDAAVLMSSQLEAVGIKSSITQEVPPTITEHIYEGVMNVSSIYNYAADPYTLYSLYGCDQVGKGPNYGHFCDPAVDKALVDANATVDQDERIKAYQAVQQTLMREALFVPIYDNSAVWVMDPSVKGVQFTPLGIPVLSGATV